MKITKNKKKRNKKYMPKIIDLTGGLFNLDAIGLIPIQAAEAEYQRGLKAFISYKNSTCTDNDFNDLANSLHLVEELTRFIDIGFDITPMYNNIAAKLNEAYEIKQSTGNYINFSEIYSDIEKLLNLLRKILPKVKAVEYRTAYTNISARLGLLLGITDDY